MKCATAAATHGCLAAADRGGGRGVRHDDRRRHGRRRAGSRGRCARLACRRGGAPPPAAPARQRFSAARPVVGFGAPPGPTVVARATVAGTRGRCSSPAAVGWPRPAPAPSAPRAPRRRHRRRRRDDWAGVVVEAGRLDGGRCRRRRRRRAPAAAAAGVSGAPPPRPPPRRPGWRPAAPRTSPAPPAWRSSRGPGARRAPPAAGSASARAGVVVARLGRAQPPRAQCSCGAAYVARSMVERRATLRRFSGRATSRRA